MPAEPSFQSEFQQLGHDLKSFIQTRYEMLRAELSAGFTRLRGAAVLIAAAAVFAMTGLILLGFCVAFAIGLAFGAFPNQLGLVWGFLITGGGAMILAAMVGAAGKSKLKPEELAPKRTLEVLRRDGETFRQGGEQHGYPSATRRSA